MKKHSMALFLAGAGVAVAAAFLVGISDNPPGILLLYGATASLILAFVHSWRSSKRFLILTLASIAGFPLAVFLHNAFEAIAGMAAGMILPGILNFLGVVFFLVAVFACPAGLLIGGVGALATIRRAK